MMKHIRSLSRVPAHAADVPVTTKIDFVTAILDAFKPIIEAKESEDTTT